MSTTASAVSPPGLQRPRTRPSLESSLYSRGLLLKLASSPLVSAPSSLAPLDEWFGDYQPYTPRPNNQQSHQYREHGDHQGHGGMRYNNHRGGGGADRERDGGDKGSFARGVPPHIRMQQDDASGPMGEFSHHKSSHHDNGNASGAAGSYLSGFQGVRRREGERGGDNRPDRMDKGERHERGYRRHEDGNNREGGESPRFTNAERQGYQARFAGGKNPFGQLSASGTFRPAGKDGSEHQGRFPMGRMGRNERDADQSSGALDDNGRPIRMGRTQAAGGKDFGAGRERRRFPQDFADEAAGASGVPTDEDDGTWETVVPRSPDAERKLARAGALADAASDWRRGPGSAGLPKRVEGLGGRGERRGDHREDSRRAGGGLGNNSSASFPAWMADEAETPSWMDDASQAANNSNSNNHNSSADRKERGKLNFDAFKGAEIHATPLEGEDSIQAFKREMKERERRAREKDGGPAATASGGGVKSQNESTSTPAARHPPPGLSKPVSTETTDQGNGSTTTQHKEQSERAPVNPAEPGQQSRPVVREDKSAASNPAAAAAAAAGGRGSSRFARFFDETAVTNKVKEAQERAMAGQSQASGVNGQGPTDRDGGASRGQSSGLDSLLQGMQMGPSTGDRARHQDSSMPPSQQVSSADNEGMQKIMALLRGGQAIPSEQPTPSTSTPSSRPQALPASNATSSAAAAGLMAMLSGQRPSPQQETGPSQQHYAAQSAAALLDQRRNLASASPMGMASPISQLPPQHQHQRAQSPSYGFRAQSPSVSYQQQEHQQHQQQQRFGTPWNGAPPGLGDNMQGYREAAVPPHLHNQFASLPPHIQHSIMQGRTPMPPPPGMPPMMHQYHPQQGHPVPHMQYGAPQHLGPYSQQQGGSQRGEAGAPPGLFGHNMGGH